MIPLIAAFNSSTVFTHPLFTYSVSCEDVFVHKHNKHDKQITPETPLIQSRTLLSLLGTP